MSGEVI
jgi:hypothetical protein